MKREQFLRAKLGDAWCMRGDDFAAMVEAMRADDPVGRRFDGMYLHPQVQIVQGVAYVPIRGVLLRGVSFWDALCGDYDTALLEEQIKNIADDASVKAVLFDVDSPGGLAMGMGSVSEKIAGLRAAGKKTVAFSGGMCCSAAYYAMASCEFLLGTVDSIWGSISTYSAGVDSSKAWAMAGRELKLYRTGELKGVGLPGKAWTDEEMAAVKERVDAIDANFKGFVKKHRPQLADEAMNGNHWYAKHAPEGLVDGVVGSVEEVLEYLLKG